MRSATILSAALLVLSCPAPARAGTLKIVAYGPDGALLDTASLRRMIAPEGEDAPPSGPGGLRLRDPQGELLPGAPWWVSDSTSPVWRWTGDERAVASLPWPIQRDGFSTLFLDGGGEGYSDGQTLLLNEELASTAYRLMQDSLKERTSRWTPIYRPGKRVREALASAKEGMAAALAERDPRARAALFDRSLSATSGAWQRLLCEHGRQASEDPKTGPPMRRGLTLDESLLDRVSEYDWIAAKVSESGANWVRIVFRAEADDFPFSRRSSFTLYDQLVDRLLRRKIRVMGSVLDSMLWPASVSPEECRERTRNLVFHFKDRIRSWEVASEPNGDWLGGRPSPLSPEAVLACVDASASEVKAIDPSLETVATLHWWDGTAPDDRHALPTWLDWSRRKGFGKDFDLVAMSIYPDRHPMGLAFDPAFRRLRRAFPEQRLMVGGLGFGTEGEREAYWWLEPGNTSEARKDVLVFYTAAAGAAAPGSVGGGFWWPTLEQMLPPEKETTPLYRLYQRSLRRLER